MVDLGFSLSLPKKRVVSSVGLEHYLDRVGVNGSSPLQPTEKHETTFMNEKEYDAPMHSAEHLLNQTMVRMFGCGRAFSSHVERKKSKCDYRIDRVLLEEELREIERRVNDMIDKGVDVTEEFVTRAQAAERFNLSRLPESAGDRVRIVRMGEYDACPCIGPHVQNTKQIGRFKILSSDYNEGVVRIRFKREAVE